MTKKLPVFELKCDDIETFVDAIALVESPAIEKEFIAFSTHKKIDFSFNDDKMELIGAVMVPDQRIYRRNEDGFEYEVFFSKNTIRSIAQSFAKNSNHSNLNIEHSGKSADSFMYQSMLVDSAMGIKPMDLPDGTWVAVVKVLNRDVWQDIKNGKHKGFSIEGVFELEKSMFNQNMTAKELEELADEQEAIKLFKEITDRLTTSIFKSKQQKS